MKAPIVLFAYKRADHLRKCISALRDNMYADESILIIYSDGPKSEKDQEGVNEVRSFIKEIHGFKRVDVIERPENFGLSKSVLRGVTEVIGVYGKVIVLEDDLITSRFFLKFMNDALDRFESDDRVISIHSYIYPVSETLPEIFFLRGADCWGWATWKRGWDLLETDGTALLSKLQNEHSRRFDFDNAYPYTKMLSDQVAGLNNSWAILWYASAFVKNKLTLYPGTSLSRNIGNDDSGTHSVKTNRYNVEVSEKEINVDQPVEVADNPNAVKAITNYFIRTHARYGVLRSFLKNFLGKFK